MVWIYKHLGTWFGDYWWCGWRNKAYGLAYALKPECLKLDSYASLAISTHDTMFYRIIRVESRKNNIVEEYFEYMFKFGLFFVLMGYRLRPIRDTQLNGCAPKPMDGRPIFSIRAGNTDA